MSEVQGNSVLSSQSVDSVDSFKQDENGEPIMSKSKARSLRRKRAKQRKVTGIQEEKKAESQDKENLVDPLAQESQAAKKKKKSRKRKKKTDVIEQPNKDLANINSTEAPIFTCVKKLNANNTETASLATALTNVKTEVEKSMPENTGKTQLASSVKTEVEKSMTENSGKTQLASSVKISSPFKKEPIHQAADDSVATPLQTTGVGASEQNVMPTSVYEDDNENKDRTKEDCTCACVIS